MFTLPGKNHDFPTANHDFYPPARHVLRCEDVSDRNWMNGNGWPIFSSFWPSTGYEEAGRKRERGYEVGEEEEEQQQTGEMEKENEEDESGKHRK